MKFTVVVTVFQKEYLVPRMLHCLASQTCVDWAAHFIADGRHALAQDAVRSFAEQTGLPVSWVTGERRRGSHGNHLRRQELHVATGDYVCFIGHDCLIDPDYLAIHREQIEVAGKKPVISVVSCRFWHDKHWKTQQPLAMETYRGILPPPSDPDKWKMGDLDLTCVAFPVSVARTQEAFHTSFERRYAADWLSYQACLSVVKVVVSRKVVCAHF